MNRHGREAALGNLLSDTYSSPLYRAVTFIGTVRDAAAKSLSEIQEELARYQRCVPEESFAIRRIQRFARMPLWMARLLHWRMTRSPDFYIRNVGSCGVTFLEGDWGEHMFPIAPTSVVFGIGAACSEPVLRDDTIGIGRVLKCTLMIDNFVVSGLTGSRLVRDFKELLESGSFITDELRQAGKAKGDPALTTVSHPSLQISQPGNPEPIPVCPC